jgi:hypothetical protein
MFNANIGSKGNPNYFMGPNWGYQTQASRVAQAINRRLAKRIKELEKNG